MNIVIVGGGSEGKFGQDFINKATQDGHTVINYSYREPRPQTHSNLSGEPHPS